MGSFTLRGAVPSDAEFIIRAFDSAIDYLPTIGSGNQWGDKHFSEQPSRVEELGSSVDACITHQEYQEQEERKYLDALAKKRDGGKEEQQQQRRPPIQLFDPSSEAKHLRAVIAEVLPEVESGGVDADKVAVPVPVPVPAAVSVFQDFFPEKIAQFPGLPEPMAAAAKRADYIYLYILVSDLRVGPARKGTGAALVRETISMAKRAGKKMLYVDCWAGNDGKLVKFYENQGFKLVVDFHAQKSDGSDWHGAFLEIDLDTIVL